MKFLGLGDNSIDCYTNLNEMYPGGNAVNTAVHASILGAVSAYLGNLATDDLAGLLLDALSRFRVDTSACRTIQNSTTKCCLYTVTDGEREYQGITAGEDWAGPIRLTQADLDYIRTFSMVHCSCNAKIEDQIFLLSGLPALFLYDFGEKEKYRTAAYYDKVCHGLDLALFSCPAMSDTQIEAFCDPLHKRGVKLVLVTMGQSGQCVSTGSALVHGAAEYVHPTDTMGAGDSFLTSFALSLYEQGWRKNCIPDSASLSKALQTATAYSTANCMKKGGFGYLK